MFLKELIVIKQINQKSMIFATIDLFLDKGFKFQPDVCNRCHDVLMSLDLSNIAILNIHGPGYCCIISEISKSEAINLIQNTEFTEKSGTLQNIKTYFDI